MSEKLPSKSEANHLIRVLSNTPKKYTVTIHYKDGSKVEFQADNPPKLDWSTEARCLWINKASYSEGPICQHEPGMVILSEENPEWQEKGKA